MQFNQTHLLKFLWRRRYYCDVTCTQNTVR